MGEAPTILKGQRRFGFREFGLGSLHFDNQLLNVNNFETLRDLVVGEDLLGVHIFHQHLLGDLLKSRLFDRLLKNIRLGFNLDSYCPLLRTLLFFRLWDVFLIPLFLLLPPSLPWLWAVFTLSISFHREFVLGRSTPPSLPLLDTWLNISFLLYRLLKRDTITSALIIQKTSFCIFW